MLHLFSCAVNPPLRLPEALRRWEHIAHALAERPRKRRPQMETLFDWQN